MAKKESAPIVKEHGEAAKVLHAIMPQLHEAPHVTEAAERFREDEGSPLKREKALAHWLFKTDRLLGRGDDVESRVWRTEVARLVMDAKNIPESYWAAQKQIARDNGRGDIEITDHIKDKLARELQDAQRTGAESWAGYLEQTGSQYPLWFKMYAWDGMSKLGVFDKKKGRYKKRDDSTVAPYPQLNPAVLAKVYDAVKSQHVDGEPPANKELGRLVKGGSFNQLYSYMLLDQKAIIPTPEKAEDVVGEWKKYTHEDVDAITEASEGTPWCIAGSDLAERYTDNGGEFYLFHLQDPETGVLSPTAAASVRMSGGKVSEISGLANGTGQDVEDSLVPVVMKKLKSLPGGEHHLEYLEDKQRLIDMDTKFKNGQDFSYSELVFLYELDREIIPPDNPNTEVDKDPRVAEFRQSRDFVEDMVRIFNSEDPLYVAEQLLKSEASSQVLATNFYKFGGILGADWEHIVDRLVEGGQALELMENIEHFRGYSCKKILSKVLECEGCYLLLRDLSEVDAESRGIYIKVMAENGYIEALADYHKLHIPEDQVRDGTALKIVQAGYGKEIIESLAAVSSLEPLGESLEIALVDSNCYEVFLDNLHSFKNLTSGLADRLIDSGNAGFVSRNLSNFSDITPSTAERLAHGAKIIEGVVKRIDSLSAPAAKAFAQEFKNSQKYYRDFGDVLDSIKKYEPRARLAVSAASRLIEVGEASAVLGRSSLFEGLVLDRVLAAKIIDSGRAIEVARHIDRFDDCMADAALAERIILDGHGWYVANDLRKFEGLTAQTAEELIAAGEADAVVHNLDSFEGLIADSSLAEKLIAAGAARVVANNLRKFEGLIADSSLAEKLIAAGAAEAVVHNLDSFEGLIADSSLAEKLIAAGAARVVANNLRKFEGLIADSSLAEKLIAAGAARVVANNLRKFEGLIADSSLAEKLIAAGAAEAVVHNLDSFEGLIADSSLAEKLIAAGAARVVANNLRKFEGLTAQTAEKLIEAGAADYVVHNLSKFDGLIADSSLAEKIIVAGKGWVVVDYLSKFEGLVANSSLAGKIIEARQARVVVANISKFEGLAADSILAGKIIDSGDANLVVHNLHKFEGLTAQTAEKLIEAGHPAAVLHNLDKFEGLSREAYDDMVIRHRLTKEQLR